MKKITLIFVLLTLILGCTRNQPSDKPPIHPNLNMDDQPKYKPQAASKFFANGQAMRLPVEGTVARGMLRADSAFFYTAMDSRGNWVTNNPLEITMTLLERGQERFNIYCAPCHGRGGDGQSVMVKKGMLPPPSFHEQRLIDTADGYIFHVVTEGLRNMPPYKYQISAKDRWTIIAYFRALQRSRNATAEDLPPAELEKLGQ